MQLTGLTKQDYIISRLLERDVVVQGNLRVYQALKVNLSAVLSELNRIQTGESIPDELLETIRFIIPGQIFRISSDLKLNVVFLLAYDHSDGVLKDSG